MDFNAIMNLAKSMGQGTLDNVGGQLKNKLMAIIVNTSVGGGVVCIQMNGLYELLQIDIHPDIIKPEEKTTLQELIQLAINQAVREVRAEQKEIFSSLGIPVDLLGGIL